MKQLRQEIADKSKVIFGYGIMIALFAGGIIPFGYLAALLIGGETATLISIWIQKSYTRVIVYATTILVLFGLATMYLAGEKALMSELRKNTEETNK